jgi:hypothetical protein
MQYSKFPDINVDAWLDMGEKFEQTTVIIAVSDQPTQCSPPDFGVGSMTNHSLVVIGLPGPMVVPGTYDFSSKDVIAWGSTWLSDGMGNGGGGSTVLTAGQVEIVQSDDSTAIVLKLSGLTNQLATENGQHVAAFCQ